MPYILGFGDFVPPRDLVTDEPVSTYFGEEQMDVFIDAIREMRKKERMLIMMTMEHELVECGEVLSCYRTQRKSMGALFRIKNQEVVEKLWPKIQANRAAGNPDIGLSPMVSVDALTYPHDPSQNKLLSRSMFHVSITDTPAHGNQGTWAVYASIDPVEAMERFAEYAEKDILYMPAEERKAVAQFKKRVGRIEWSDPKWREKYNIPLNAGAARNRHFYAAYGDGTIAEELEIDNASPLGRVLVEISPSIPAVYADEHMKHLIATADAPYAMLGGVQEVEVAAVVPDEPAAVNPVEEPSVVPETLTTETVAALPVEVAVESGSETAIEAVSAEKEQRPSTEQVDTTPNTDPSEQPDARTNKSSSDVSDVAGDPQPQAAIADNSTVEPRDMSAQQHQQPPAGGVGQPAVVATPPVTTTQAAAPPQPMGGAPPPVAPQTTTATPEADSDPMAVDTNAAASGKRPADTQPEGIPDAKRPATAQTVAGNDEMITLTKAELDRLAGRWARERQTRVEQAVLRMKEAGVEEEDARFYASAMSNGDDEQTEKAFQMAERITVKAVASKKAMEMAAAGGGGAGRVVQSWPNAEEAFQSVYKQNTNAVVAKTGGVVAPPTPSATGGVDPMLQKLTNLGLQLPDHYRQPVVMTSEAVASVYPSKIDYQSSMKAYSAQSSSSSSSAPAPQQQQQQSSTNAAPPPSAAPSVAIWDGNPEDRAGHLYTRLSVMGIQPSPDYFTFSRTYDHRVRSTNHGPSLHQSLAQNPNFFQPDPQNPNVYMRRGYP